MTESLSFKLEVFEGPLDLMLSLIAKHKLNIYDIEISSLCEQFMLYLDQMKQADMDIAGEFLEMAARLILIKSSALLPKYEADELKKELEGALIEYALCKNIALQLRELYHGDDIFVRQPLEIEQDKTYNNIHDPDELFLAMSNINFKTEVRRLPKTVRPVTAKSYVSVFTKVLYVLRKVMYCGQSVSTDELFKGQTRSEQVAVFLALLELSKNSRIKFTDDNKYLHFVPKEDIEKEFAYTAQEAADEV
ncbi:MAG: segregation/condensation protein A [Eubacterium sp.]|nr:segregation/condensation protein A [Eubacterium sp.]